MCPAEGDCMKLKVKTTINSDKLLSKVRSDAFWQYSTGEWHKLISPYTPMETGITSESVEVRPKEIEYKAPQAHYLYKGKLMIDPETGSSYARKDAKKVYADKDLDLKHNKHPLSSKEWDKAAEPLQKPKLIKAMKKFLKRG